MTATTSVRTFPFRNVFAHCCPPTVCSHNHIDCRINGSPPPIAADSMDFRNFDYTNVIIIDLSNAQLLVINNYLVCCLTTIKGRVPWTVFTWIPLIMLSLVRFDILLAAVVGVSCLAFLVARTSRRRLPYPPGPKRLPIVGNLFSMPSQEEWVTYSKWSKDFGMRRT